MRFVKKSEEILKNKKLNNKSIKYESDIFFYFGIGFLIFIAMLVTVSLTTFFDKYLTPKINGITTAKLEIYAAHVEHNTISKTGNTIAINKLANTKNYFTELLQDKHWSSSIFIDFNEQKKDIDAIVKQLLVFEKLSKQEYITTSNPEYDTSFYSLLNKIDDLRIALNKQYLQQQNTLHYARIGTVISLLLFIFGVLFIATKRKRIRENLLLAAKNTNFFLEEAQKIAKLISYTYDFETNKWNASRSYLDIVGNEVNVNSTRPWIDIIHPEDKSRITTLFNKRAKNLSTKFNETYRIINATTGKTHWIQHVIQDKKKDEKGNLLPVQGIIQDITQHKLAREEIKRSNVILNKINSLVIVMNRKSDVTYASKGVRDILGYQPKDMLGQGWWEITYSDVEEAQKTKNLNYDYFFSKNSSLTSDNEFSLRRIKTKDGKYKWIRWSFTKESENSFIAIGLDVTKSHEKSKRYIALTETAHDAIIITDDKGKIVDVNNTAVKMFGYLKEDFLEKHLSALVPKKHATSFIQEFTNANKKGYYTKSETRRGGGLTKDGVIFPVEVSFNSWLDDEGNKTHCAFIKDITQQRHEARVKKIIYDITKHTQEKPTLNALLSFIKESLSTIIDSSTFLVSLYDDKKQKFDFYESKGKSLFDYVIDTKESLLYTKSTKLNGTQIKTKTKSKCWIGVPLMAKQEAIGVMSVRNYTDENAYSQKDVELLELIASTISQVIQQTKDFERINLLNQALTQSSALIVITNTTGIIEYVNPYFTKITGYESSDILGRNPRLIGIRNKNESIYENLWKTITKGESWKGELTNVKKDGTQYIVMATIAPVKNNNGEITHYISVQEDVTEKRKLEAQFINGFIEAQEIEKQHFGQELHDGISQILSAETMYIDILIKQNQDRINDKAKFLTKIKELNLSAANEARNIAHGLMSNQLTKTGLIKAIENICIDYSSTKNIEFTYLYENISEDELSKEIKINLFRIVQEVTTNIVRHSEATQATITFTKLKNNTLNLIIEDNGIGIDKTKGKIKGIGFENIKRRVTLLNGTLNIDTSPNKGLCYTINIPCKCIFS